MATNEEDRYINDFVLLMRTKLAKDRQKKRDNEDEDVHLTTKHTNNRYKKNEQQRQFNDLKQRKMLHRATEEATSGLAAVGLQPQPQQQQHQVMEGRAEDRCSTTMCDSGKPFALNTNTAGRGVGDEQLRRDDNRGNAMDVDNRRDERGVEERLGGGDEQLRRELEQCQRKLEVANRTSVNVVKQLDDMQQKYNIQGEVLGEMETDVDILRAIEERVRQELTEARGSTELLRQELTDARETTELIRREKEAIRRNYELLASQIKRFTKNRVEVTDAQRVYYAEEVRAQLDTNPSVFKKKWSDIVRGELD